MQRHYQPTIVKQHLGPNTTHLIYRFENGYGASVVPEYDYLSSNLIPIIHPQVLLELAVVYWDDKNEFHLFDWTSPILQELGYDDNPVRRVTQEQVDVLLDKIAGL
jgi:hypothetical protein